MVVQTMAHADVEMDQSGQPKNSRSLQRYCSRLSASSSTSVIPIEQSGGGSDTRTSGAGAVGTDGGEVGLPYLALSVGPPLAVHLPLA